jgi:hypothetical protein
MRRLKHRQARALSLAMLLLFSGTATAIPLRTWGYVELVYRHLELDGEGARDVGQLNVEISGETFIWRPWFARLEGSLRLGLGDSKGETTAQSTRSVGGSTRLRWLPESKFPGSLFLEYRDNAVDTGLDDNLEFIASTLELKQQYRLQNGPQFALSYREVERDDRSELFQDRPISVKDEFLQFSGDYDREFQQFRFRSLLQTFSNARIQRKDRRNRHLLEHRFRPSPNFSLNSRFSLVQDEVSSDSLGSGIDTLQLNSFLSYRLPWQRATRLSANILLQDQAVTSTFLDQSLQTANLLVAANTNWNDRLSFSAGLSHFDRQSEDDSSSQSRESLGVNYRQPLPFLTTLTPYWEAFGRVRAEQFGDGDGSGESVTEDFETTLGTGYSIRWGLPIELLPTNFSASQRISVISGDIREFDEIISRVGLNATGQISGGSLNAGINISHSLRDGDTDLSEALVANVNSGYRYNLGRTESLTFSVGWQYSDGTDINGNELETTTTYSFNAGYRNQDLFGIPRLTFTSELRYYSQNLETFLQSELELVNHTRDRSTWRNRLEYQVGMLSLLAQADLIEVEGRLDTFLMLRARRNLGQLF